MKVKKPLKIGEAYAYLVSGGRQLDELNRIESEEELQSIIKRCDDKIFRKKMMWISETGKYGDMFGIGKDKRLVFVEIKCVKSRGDEGTGYGLKQVLKQYKRAEAISGRKGELKMICEDFEHRLKKELKLDYKKLRIDYKPDFYFISTQFPEKVLKDAEKIEKNISRWKKVKIKCLMANVFKRSKKEILVVTRLK